ncbi:MAG: protein kinase [bacterium]
MNPDKIDQYTIQRPAIAKGGFGVVHEATSPDGRRIAVKVLNREAVEMRIEQMLKAKNPGIERDLETLRIETQKAYAQNVEQFKTEYQWLTRLRHPNIAEVIDIGCHDGSYYIASEFIDGSPIADCVKGWNPEEMVPLFVQALAGLDFIHRNGLIHLDIKSANILVRRSNGGYDVKIIDFGLAMTPDEYTGKIMGTMSTMAPEVALGLTEEVDGRADLFSMAAVMYFCLTWSVSFPYPRPKATNRESVRRVIAREETLTIRPPSEVHHRPIEFPEHLEKVVMRLLAHKARDRFYPNARAVINALTTQRTEAFADTPDTLGAYLRPEHNRYIGRDDLVAQVLSGIETLKKGEPPPCPIVRIEGGEGLGKTHFLRLVHDAAGRNIEKIALHHISFPSGNDAAVAWANALTEDLAKNEKPILALVDNIHECAGISYKVAEAILGFVRLATEKAHSPEVYADIRPAMIVFTVSDNAPSVKAASEGIANLIDASKKDFEFARIVSLKPFGAKEIDEYLTSTPALDGKRPDGRRVDALLNRTSGIPREIVETLTEMDKQGILFDAEGDIVIPDLETGMGSAKASRSTEERLLAQYRALPENQRRICEIMACWRARPMLPAPTIGDILSFSTGAARGQAVRALVQADVLHYNAENDRYSFANDFMASVVHEAMDEASRGEIHRAIATLLSRDALAAEEFRDAVGYHTAYSNDAKAAARSSASLGRRLLYDVGNIPVAIELLNRACDLTKESDWKLWAYATTLLAEALSHAERHDEAGEAVREGLNLVGERSIQWRLALESRGIVHFLNKGMMDEALEMIERAQKDLAATHGAITRLAFMNLKGRYHYEMATRGMGDTTEHLNLAREIFEDTARAERELPEGARRRVSGGGLHLVHKHMGQYDLAAEALEEYIEGHELTDYALANASRELAELYRVRREYDKSLEYAAKAAALAKKKHMGRLLFHALGALANLYHDTDRFEKSVEIDNRRIAASVHFKDKMDYRRMAARIWTHMGHCYKELGLWDKAAIYFEAATGPEAEDYYRMSATQGLGEVCYEKGDLEGAFAQFDRARELLDKFPDDAISRSYRYRISYIEAQAHLRSGRPGDALALVPRLRKLAGSDEDKARDIDELERRMVER